MSKHVCRAPGCARIAVDAKYCVEHKHLEARDREKKPYFSGVRYQWQELYNSPKWKAISRTKLKDNPVCQKCGVEASTEVHHITPHRGDVDLFYDDDNLVALCHRCHTEETKREVRERSSERKRKLWY